MNHNHRSSTQKRPEINLIHRLQRWRTPLAALVLTLPMAAQAQEAVLPLQQFHPSPGGDLNFNHVEGAHTPGSLESSFGIALHYAHQPLSYQLGDEQIPLLERQPQADFMALLGLGSRLSLGIAVPVVLFQEAGAGTGSFSVQQVPSSVPGDLRIVPKVRLLGRKEGIALAVSAPIGIPTGDETAYAGESSLTIKPEALLEWRSGRLRAGLNLGYLIRQPVTQLGFTLDDEVSYGAAVGYAVQPDRLELLGEVFGRAAVASDLSNTSIPLEAMLSVRVHPAEGHALTLGGGTGLTHGYGTPTFRVLAGYSVAFGAPSTGVSPAVAAPVAPAPAIEPVAQAVAEPAPPAEPPAPRDSDGDGIADDADRCVTAPETRNGIDDGDGCPDEKPVAKLVGQDLQIAEKIYFAPGTADLQPRSLELLRAVAGFFKAHPEVKKTRIGGHTDSQGDARKNLELSQRRAEAVMSVLVEAGVEPARLYAQGFGQTRPAAPNTTAQGREKNRRVQFTVVQVESELASAR